MPSATRPDTEQTDIFGTDPDPVASPPTLPEEPADKAAALAVIADEARACTACILHGSRQNAVPGTGHPDAGLVLIGEAPGAVEDRQGLPFVGRSGQLFTDILKAIGFARDDVFICNTLKCRPPGNRDPERSEVEACEAYLRRQLDVIRPRLILCLGAGRRADPAGHHGLAAVAAPFGALLRRRAGDGHLPSGSAAAQPGHKRDTWDDVRKLRALFDNLGSVEA